MRVFDVVQAWRPGKRTVVRPTRPSAVIPRDISTDPRILRCIDRRIRRMQREAQRLTKRRDFIIGGDYLTWLQRVMLDAHIFQIAAATTYYWQHQDDQPTFGDFPSPIPAIPCSWFEGTTQEGERFGVLLQSGPVGDGSVEHTLSRKRLAQIATSDSRFFVDAHVVWLRYPDDNIAEPAWLGRFSWTVNGSQGLGPAILWMPPDAMTCGFQLLPPERKVGGDVSGVLGGILFALSLLHCKNVTTVPASGSRQLRRARERLGQPVVEYRTLVIEPITRAIGAHGNGGGWENRFHICRGHFKQYDERPLFGRVKGRFWWPAHTRGNANLGAIAKQYVEASPVE